MQNLKAVLAAIQQGKSIHPMALAQAQAELARLEALLLAQSDKQQ